MVGQTTSTSFPTTTGAFQATAPAGTNAFVAKLTPTGSALAYGTYLGGASTDEAWDVAVDAAGAAYVAGRTYSSDFPTLGAVQAVLGGASDAFLAKLTPTGSALTYATYLGGSGHDYGNAVAVDGEAPRT